MKGIQGIIKTALFLIGLSALFIIERNFAATDRVNLLRAIYACLIALPLLLHAVDQWKLRKNSNIGQADCEVFPLTWKLVVAISVILWALWRHITLDATTPNIYDRLLLGTWIVLLLTGLVSGIGIEWAAWNSRTDSDAGRIKKAASAWFATGLLLCSLAGLNFTAVKRDVSRDWSYLKVTEPSAETISLSKNAPAMINVGAFFPRDNEVLPWVESYLKHLQSKAPERITLTITDKDLDPVAAETFQTSRNGVIILQVGARSERLDLGPTLVAARPILKKFDSEIARLLNLLTTSEKVAYVMRGHGELKPDVVNDDSLLTSSKLIEGFLRDQNWTVKTLGLSEGSASKIPTDATAIFIIAPASDLMKEEITTLDNYLTEGGSVFIALEPARKSGELVNWLAGIGAQFNSAPLANERNHVAASRTPVDNWFLFTSSFKSHESVRTLARNDDRATFLFFESGSFNIEPASNAWKVTETIRTLADTFRDDNKNFKFDTNGEKRGVFPVAIAATRPVPPKVAPNAAQTEQASNMTEARLIALADSSAISDALIKNQANIIYVADTLKWLAKEPVSGSGPAVEEDVKIQQTSTQDLIWFYGSVIMVPLCVLGAGGLLIRNNRKSRVRNGKQNTSLKGSKQ